MNGLWRNLDLPRRDDLGRWVVGTKRADSASGIADCLAPSIRIVDLAVLAMRCPTAPT